MTLRSKQPASGKPGPEEKTLLEKAARLIDPPGREVSDAELRDPGANIPDEIPGAEHSGAGRKTPPDRPRKGK